MAESGKSCETSISVNDWIGEQAQLLGGTVTSYQQTMRVFW